jgi:hypothetical protein
VDEEKAETFADFVIHEIDDNKVRTEPREKPEQCLAPS